MHFFLNKITNCICEIDSHLLTFDSPDEDHITESILVENGLAEKEPYNEIEIEPEVPCVSKAEGESAFNTFKMYVQQLPSTSSEDIKQLNKVFKNVETLASFKQSTLNFHN